eukprot:CAMPEP_0178993910 /NCGR_PEP_ID=MMETSP0795-20121207/6976_1 /TAXON_ID=88552 /ORGANISM="Amoebophrya sp., Strain Ameob2" /LENGTH=51 /DNA_ID=CAMNT_0020686043 /DNA_START=200 /DNA_END=352 /DNA_ORIENTATION=-
MTFGVMPGTSTLACSQSLSDRSGRITMRPSAERLGTTRPPPFRPETSSASG